MVMGRQMNEAAAVYGNAHLQGCTEAAAERREEERARIVAGVIEVLATLLSRGGASRRGKVDARKGDGA
jgi:hypothetical protein